MAPKIRKIFVLLGALFAVMMFCGCVANKPIVLSASPSALPSLSPSALPSLSPTPEPSISSEPPKTEPSASQEPVLADNFIFSAECWETAEFVTGATSIMIEMKVPAGTPVFAPYDGEVSKIYWGNEDDGVYEMSVEFTSMSRTSVTITAAVIKTPDALTDERENSEICLELNTPLKTMEVLAGETVGTIGSDEILGFCVFGNVALEFPPEEEIPADMSPLEFVKFLLAGPPEPDI